MYSVQQPPYLSCECGMRGCAVNSLHGLYFVKVVAAWGNGWSLELEKSVCGFGLFVSRAQGSQGHVKIIK